ncbi:U32 family peptidase [Leptolyngbya sp. 'hensonii']|uniref:U32 family peptidase n=1 Tax=Leptolyngbya sp. 'hensonii' TaxID=1922337 RepID=UPI0009F8E31B|nr:U32 family peptidase [Leptolyngbya sp. 'hensonii']
MTERIRPVKPEVMSPAGYWPQLQAAIEAGADAVYFGLHHFTARAKVGFSLEELPAVMRTLHQRGVKGYITFNTLVFDAELEAAARTLATIATADVDAVIVQDVGIAQLVRQIAPDLPVHGSTQMSITSAEGVWLAQQFGVSRVVLARELSLKDIRTIRTQTDCDLEIFVHGALCVSYSGQCFSSEAWGGRSANRGQCAQACRLPYDLLVDGQKQPLGDARYLLSPGDLYALHQVPEIIQSGISTLKIEGRYKDADYVALTTRAYRQAVDEAWAGLPLSLSRQEELQLEQVYSRGLGPYFVTGTNHQAVVGGRSPRHRGVLMGRVLRVAADRVTIAPSPMPPEMGLKAGDGVVFDAADWRSPGLAEEGGRLYQVIPVAKASLELRFANGAINFARIRSGDWVWRTHDPNLDQVVRPFVAAKTPVARQPVQVRVVAQTGEPLKLWWELINQPQIQVVVQSPEPLMPAQNRSLTPEFLQEQLGRLGNTPYELTRVELEMQGQPFAASSLLNQLRRQAIEQLIDQQSQNRTRWVNHPSATLEAVLAQIQRQDTISSDEYHLHLLVRTPEQLEAALAERPASITLDYLELYGLRPDVERVRSAEITVRVASPRILKPNEQRILRFLLSLDCALLVRSGGLLQALQSEAHPPLIGDFSLNAANVLSAATFLELGLDQITPTHDLNAAQVKTLAHYLGPDRLEVIAYQHLPVFHTEHCVFCRFLSEGSSYKDCGHPCEQHRVALRDSQGRTHPVMADVGCRNTVFGAEAQEASRHLDSWRNAGLRHFRLEFAHETAEQVSQISRVFRETLQGQRSSADLTRRLQRLAPQGTTQGSLYIPSKALDEYSFGQKAEDHSNGAIAEFRQAF